MDHAAGIDHQRAILDINAATGGISGLVFEYGAVMYSSAATHAKNATTVGKGDVLVDRAALFQVHDALLIVYAAAISASRIALYCRLNEIGCAVEIEDATAVVIGAIAAHNSVA